MRHEFDRINAEDHSNEHNTLRRRRDTALKKKTRSLRPKLCFASFRACN
jgi:hypothetical protein